MNDVIEWMGVIELNYMRTETRILTVNRVYWLSLVHIFHFHGRSHSLTFDFAAKTMIMARESQMARKVWSKIFWYMAYGEDTWHFLMCHLNYITFNLFHINRSIYWINIMMIHTTCVIFTSTTINNNELKWSLIWNNWVDWPFAIRIHLLCDNLIPILWKWNFRF